MDSLTHADNNNKSCNNNTNEDGKKAMRNHLYTGIVFVSHTSDTHDFYPLGVVLWMNL